MAGEYFDELETREPRQREAQLLAALPGQVAHAQKNSAAFAKILHGVDAQKVTSREALAKLPVIRKHELLEMQKAARATERPSARRAASNWASFASSRPLTMTCAPASASARVMACPRCPCAAETKAMRPSRRKVSGNVFAAMQSLTKARRHRIRLVKKRFTLQRSKSRRHAAPRPIGNRGSPH